MREAIKLDPNHSGAHCLLGYCLAIQGKLDEAAAEYQQAIKCDPKNAMALNGQRVRCLVRGDMVITGMTDAPIPWPVGIHDRGRRSLIVYKDLAKAIRRESNRAICHWWGVCPSVIWKWRWVLRVPDGRSKG